MNIDLTKIYTVTYLKNLKVVTEEFIDHQGAANRIDLVEQCTDVTLITYSVNISRNK